MKYKVFLEILQNTTSKVKNKKKSDENYIKLISEYRGTLIRNARVSLVNWTFVLFSKKLLES